MALLDFRGFRLMALSLLPIGKNTLVYGSADAGKTVANSNPSLNKMIEVASKELNLKAHGVGPEDDRKIIYTCCDLEGKDLSMKFYYFISF
jgi:hypothetical protein